MNTQESTTIAYLMQGQPLSATEAIRLILEALETLGKDYPRERLIPTLRDCIRKGIQAHARETEGIRFREAVARVLHCKQDRSPRTIQDFRQCMNTLMARVPELAERPLGSLTPEQCSHMLEESFTSPTRRRKAHACLSTLLRHGMRMGWCRENPVRNLEAPRVRERTIFPLSREEVGRLLHTAHHPEHQACLPALGLMLYAGVRPHEVTRLSWNDIDLDEGEISIPPRHSKTGGGRHIPVCPALRHLLTSRHPQHAGHPICPPNWQNRWRALRREAGFSQWQQDVLRHTFASYYAKAYQDLPSLQLYMGHRDVTLLLTRYINLKGLKRDEALNFFRLCQPPASGKQPKPGSAPAHRTPRASESAWEPAHRPALRKRRSRLQP